jgi:transposase
MLGVFTFHESWEAPMNEYDGKQFVGIDLHRQRSVIVRQAESGEQLSAVRIVNDPVALGLQLEDAGADPEVVLEATYGWYWAVDVLQAHGARVHLAHPLGVKGFRYRRVKNDVRDAGDLVDLLRMGRLPEAWIAPPATRELRELVRYRASQAARSVSPLLSRARDAAERTRRNELTRLEARLQALEPSEREAVELLTRRLVAKLLHTPTIKLKAAAGTPRGEVLAEAFRELFGLQ